MVSRRNVKPSLGDSVRRLFNEATKGHTGSPGVTVYEPDEGVVLQSPGGQARVWGGQELVDNEYRVLEASTTADLDKLRAAELELTGDVAEQLAAQVGTFGHLVVTEELIATNISIVSTGHELMQQGALTVAGPAGIVELTGSGYKAWNAAGQLTANLNGYENTLTGKFQTAETGQRVRIQNVGSIAAVDLFASNNGDDHLGVWYNSATDPWNSVAFIQAMPTLQNGPTNPGINLYPNRGTFEFQGKWEVDTNSLKAAQWVSSAGLAAGAWTNVRVDYPTAFPDDSDLRLFPMLSVGTGQGVPVVATTDGHDRYGVNLQVNNLSTAKASGPIYVRVMCYRFKP